MNLKSAPAYAVTFAPASLWFCWAVARYGPTIGYVRAVALSVFTGIGIVGLSALLVAYLPALVERLGFRRAGALLRRWWDRDAL